MHLRQQQRKGKARWGLCLALAGLTCCGLSLWAQSPGAATNCAAMRIAFSGRMFVDVNENDAGAAVRAWALVLGNERGVPINPAVRILQGTNALRQALQQRLIEAITLPIDEYWALHKELPLNSWVAGLKDGRATEQYVLLVHRQRGIEHLADLRGHTLALLANPRTSLAPAWLETLLAQEGSGRLSEFFKQVTSCTKLTRAVLPVFFQQVDACVVTRQGFATAQELNPQLGRQLKVLAASPEVVPVVFCFRGDYESPFRTKLLEALGNVNLSPAGQQFMTLFQCDRLAQIEEASLHSAFELLEAHERLCASGRPGKGRQ